MTAFWLCLKIVVSVIGFFLKEECIVFRAYEDSGEVLENYVARVMSRYEENNHEQLLYDLHLAF